MQILSQYCLKDLLVDYVNESFTVEGYNEQWVAQASNRIAMLLKEPVFTVQVDPEFMVAMSVLRNSKKHFSMQTNCWLHLQWASRKISCYGLNGGAANMHVQQILHNVQSSANTPDPGRGHHLAEEIYDRALKPFVKQNIMDIENETGCKLAIQKDLPEKGLMVVQFYGTQEQIERGKQMVREAQSQIQNSGGIRALETPLGDDQPVVQNQKGNEMQMRNGQHPIFVICNNNDKTDVKDASAVLDPNTYMNGTAARIPQIKNLPETSCTWSQQSGCLSSSRSSLSSTSSGTLSPTLGCPDGHSYGSPVPGLQFAVRPKGTAPKVQRPPQYQLVNCMSSPTFKVSQPLTWDPIGTRGPLAKSQVEHRTLWPGAVVSQCTNTKESLTAEQRKSVAKIKQIVNNAAVDNNWVVGFLNHVNSTGLDLRDIQQYLSQQVKATATKHMDHCIRNSLRGLGDIL
jgi:uncharacterized protein YvpB